MNLLGFNLVRFNSIIHLRDLAKRVRYRISSYVWLEDFCYWDKNFGNSTNY
jgi:hypothetical protein